MSQELSNELPPEKYQSAKNFAIACYALFGLGIISMGILALVGLILSYVKRNDLQNTLFYHHFSYLIRTFWIYFALQILGLLLLAAKGIGIIILIIVYIWYIYRLISGFTKLIDNRTV